MITKKKQQSFLNKEGESLLKHIELYLRKRSMSDLHRFRVSCKHINMLVWLNRKITGDTSIQTTFLPVKNIFRISGQIREVQMHLHLLSPYRTKIQTLIPDLSKEEKKLENNLLNQGLKGLKEIRSSLTALPDLTSTISGKDVKKLIEKEIRKIHSELDPAMSAEDLHKVRKRIKTLVYLTDLGKTSDVDRTYLHRCEELIGEWHDINLLSAYLNSKKDIPKSLLKEFDRKEQKLLNKIATEFHRFKRKVMR